MSVETKARPSPLGKRLNLSEMVLHLRTALEDLRNPHRFICEEFLAETVPWASITTKRVAVHLRIS